MNAIILGLNGDVEFGYLLQKNLKIVSKNVSQAHYKQLSGEHNTALAFGLWLVQNHQTQEIPEIISVISKISV